MIEGGKNIENVVAAGSLVGFEVDRQGVGFSLQPVGGYAKFPVYVYLDRNIEPVVVQSAAWQGDTSFNKLRVDVTPSNGKPGDTWRLQTRPQATDGELQRPATDSRGRMVVVQQEPGLQWQLGTAGNWETVNNSRGDLVKLYLKPGRDTAQVSTAVWKSEDFGTDLSDVSWPMDRAARALFQMHSEVETPGERTGAIKMFAELCASPEAPPYKTLEITEVWDARDGNDIAPAVIQLGAAAEEASGLLLASARRAPYARFGFRSAAGPIFVDPDGDAKQTRVLLTFW